jgi:hypothetical protein
MLALALRVCLSQCPFVFKTHFSASCGEPYLQRFVPSLYTHAERFFSGLTCLTDFTFLDDLN